MQYDENAEKYGYEGEMTPIECDELQSYKGDVTIPVYGTIADADVYLKKDVDAVITELKNENLSLKAKNIELQSFCDLHGNVDNYIDKVKAENAELKKKLENAKATEVDKVLAQKDFEIDRLQEFNAFLKQRVSNGDVNCSTLLDDLEQKDKEIARLKDKHFDVKDFAHVLKAFKFYLCKLTHCAYDERTAQWIIDNWEQDYKRIEAYK